jgi:hypothetical protein
VGSDFDPEAILVLAIGSRKTVREYFKHTPPTPLELENAIQIVEDEITLARTLVSEGSRLYTTDAAVHEIARFAGFTESSAMVLGIEAIEQTFDQLASIALGRPALNAKVISSPENAATLLILRELMHHLQIPAIIAVKHGKTMADSSPGPEVFVGHKPT